MLAARPGLEKIVRDALRRAPREEAVLYAWPLVAGALVAEKTEAVGCERDRLRVLVPDATWQAQLREFCPQYLAAYEKLLNRKLHGIDFELASRKPSRTERK